MKPLTIHTTKVYLWYPAKPTIFMCCFKSALIPELVIKVNMNINNQHQRTKLAPDKKQMSRWRSVHFSYCIWILSSSGLVYAVWLLFLFKLILQWGSKNIGKIFRCLDFFPSVERSCVRSFSGYNLRYYGAQPRYHWGRSRSG